MIGGDSELATHEAAIRRLRSIEEYCKYLYENEQQRQANLGDLAKTYLLFQTATVTAGVAGAKWLLPEGVSGAALGVPSVLAAGALLSLSGGIVVTALSIRVRSYEGLTSASVFLELIRGATEEQVLAKRIADFSAATDHNHALNQRKAGALRLALVVYVISFVILTASFVAVVAPWGR